MGFQDFITERKVHVAAIKSMLESGYFPDYKSFETYIYKDKPDVFRAIGSGFFSIVFDHRDSSRNGEFVMKVSHTGQDDGYKEFIPVAQKYAAANSLFPKIEYFYEFPGGEFVVFLERVTVGDNAIERLFLPLAEKLWNKTKFFTRFQEVKQKYGFFGFFSFEIFGRVKWDPKFNPRQKASGYNYLIEAAKLLNVSHDQLFDYIVKTIHLGRRWDLHNGNVGYRKDGSWVFFDPIA